MLSYYVKVGVEGLDQNKLTPLLWLKYDDSIADAVADVGKPDEIGKVVAGFQKYVYQEQAMNLYVKHLILPAVALALIVGLYFTPVMVFGCVPRGLLAVSIALMSAICAFVTIGFGFSAHRRRDPLVWWWLLSATIFVLPLALLVGPLG